ncbi:MAG: NAD-dependent epimerase/dehydratase family protein [Candidatus Woesearchaeota archaeon]
MRVLVLGGRGFLGEALVNKLQETHEVHTLDTSLGGEKHIQASVLDKQALRQAFSGFSCVVHLVSLSPLREPKIPYTTIHVQATKNVVSAAKEANVSYVVYVSALGASTNAPTSFLRSKARAEQVILQHQQTLIIRPSLIVDEQNELIRALKKLSLTRLFVNLPSRVQPVVREELAEFVSKQLTKKTIGVVEVAGSEILSLGAIGKITYSSLGRGCVLLPSWTARLSARILSKLPGSRIGADQVRSLDIHNTLQEPSRGVRQVVLPTSFSSWANKTFS